MPEPTTIGLFALSALALVAIPGPNLVYIVTRSIDQGRRAGLASAFGVETATLLVALFFLAFLPQFVDPGAGPAWTQVLALGAILATIGLTIDLVYAFAGGSLATWLRGSAVLERRRRYATGGVYLALAAAALAGSRRGS